MTGLVRLGPSGIEYLTHVWNFYSGCRHGCPYCWARKLTERHKNHYPNGFEPTFYLDAFLSPLSLKKPARIGVAFMGDLFGDWVNETEDWEGKLGQDEDGYFTIKGRVFDTIEKCPQHRFLFLTKAPHNLAKWSPFPDNCWVGTTATDEHSYVQRAMPLIGVDASVKYISFEPLLGPVDKLLLRNTLPAVDWVIIGAQTKPKKMPSWDWVKDIIDAADSLGIPVFLKNNLGLPKWNCEGGVPFYKKDPTGTMELRQEVPT